MARAPKTEAIELPSGPGAVVISCPDRKDQTAVDAGQLAVSLADELKRQGRHDVIVVVVPPGMRIDMLDEGHMAMNGWRRERG